MQALIGAKKSQSQKFLENGMRIPVTLIDVKDNRVIAVMTQDKNKYQAIQLGFGIKKNASRAEVGHAKRVNLEKAPKFLKEVRILDDSTLPEAGAIINPGEVFQPGDIVDVTGTSKGKGFAGVVKRHGFHGGPKTHGQSDRHRAPGAIGQGTTPGRVYKGKRMAGRMGNENVTIRNLKVIDVTADGVLVVKGLVPGIINSLIFVKKVGTDKKFVPLWKEQVEEAQASEVAESASDQTSPSGDAQRNPDKSQTQESASLSGNQPTESEESQKTNEGSVSDSPQEGSDTVATGESSQAANGEQPEAETKEGDNANK